MKNNIKLGAHVGTSSSSLLVDLFQKIGLKTIQVMLSNPRSFSYPHYERTIEFLFFYRNLTREPLYVHSPYTVSLVKDPKERQCKFTVDYAKTLFQCSYASGTPVNFVTHLGVIPEGMPSYVAYNNLMRNLVNMYHFIGNANNSNGDYNGKFKVLLENDSGTRGRSKINSAQGLYFIFKNNVVAQWFNKMGWLGICFDTNHAYGSGFDRKKWLDFLDISEVVHFNPIPEDTKLGSHKDLHSTFLLKTSKEVKLLKKLAKRAKKTDKALILENTGEYVLKNLNTILGWEL